MAADEPNLAGGQVVVSLWRLGMLLRDLSECTCVGPYPPVATAAAAAAAAAATTAEAAAAAAFRLAQGAAAELGAALLVLTELDLTDNLIPGWAFVTSLSQALPSLAVLNLSCNRLQLPLGPPPPAAPRLAGLTTLVLGDCVVSWAQAVAVGARLPSLRHLVLCRNGISELRWDGGGPGGSGAGAEISSGSSRGGGGEAATGGSTTGASGRSGRSSSAAQHLDLAAAFPNLETLDLEGNQLSRWSEVESLAALPSLQALLLSGNRLPAVEHLGGGGGFAGLTSLLLGGNALEAWGSVDQLNLFPALVDLRLSGNPLVAANPGAGRYETIARVGRLQTLNGSAVKPTERWDAELNYLRAVTNQLAAAAAAAAEAAAAAPAPAAGGGSSSGGAAGAPTTTAAAAAAAAAEAARQRVLAQHPRFAELETKYGQLAPAAAAPAAGSVLAKGMAEVVLAHGSKELRRKLPGGALNGPAGCQVAPDRAGRCGRSCHVAC